MPFVFSCISCILGTRNSFLKIILFIYLKLDNNITVTFFSGLIKVGYLYSDIFTFKSTPSYKTLSAPFLKTASCDLGTGYGLMCYDFVSGCSDLITGLVFLVHSVLLKRNLCLLNTLWIITYSSYGNSSLYYITLRRLDFMVPCVSPTVTSTTFYLTGYTGATESLIPK